MTGIRARNRGVNRIRFISFLIVLWIAPLFLLAGTPCPASGADTSALAEEVEQLIRAAEKDITAGDLDPVSYTHLTLPTN